MSLNPNTIKFNNLDQVAWLVENLEVGVAFQFIQHGKD